jgi:hypothetical protein
LQSVNSQLHSWFDRGAIVEAILGDGAYFTPSVTFRDRHDRWLVLSQLDSWARLHKREQRALQGVLGAIREARRRGDLEAAFGIAWVSLLVEDEPDSSILLDAATVAEELKQLLQDQRGAIERDDQLATLVSSVQARIPGIR